MKKTTALILSILFISNALFAQKINSGEIIERGIKFHDSQKYSLAAKEYEKVPITDTNYYLARYELALTYSQDTTQYENALVVIDDALALPVNGFSKSLLMLKGAVLDNLKRIKESHEVFDQILKEYPEYEKAYYEKAAVYYGQKDYASAIKYYEESLMRNPYHFRSHLLLAYCYYFQGRITEALITSHFALASTDNKGLAELAVDQMKYFARANDTVVQKYKNRDKKFYNKQYDEIADLLISRIALKKKYKLKTSIDDIITRQLQVVYELASHDKNSDNFVNNYYVPLIEEVWSKDEFDELMLYFFSQYGYKFIDKAAKKKKKAVNSTKDDLRSYFRKISCTRELNYTKRLKTKNKYFIDGQKLLLGNNSSHMKDGQEKYKFTGDVKFIDAGRLVYEGRFDDKEEKQGLWKYYNSFGVLTTKENLKDGKLHGASTEWTSYGIKYQDKVYENGEAVDLVHYNQGVKAYRVKSEGDSKKSRLTLFNTNGTIESSYDMIEGDPADCDAVFKYDNGVVSDKVTFKNKKLDGLVKRYYRNGQIKEESNYVAGDLNGTFKEYYNNGRIKSEYNYKDDELNGPYKSYYLNGNIDIEGSYSKGRLDGPSKCYYYDGRPMSVATYRNAKLQSATYEDPSMKKYNAKSGGVSRFFYGNGSIASELSYNKKGNLDGPAKYFYYNGVKRQTVPYDNGKRNGKVITSFFNGNKLSEKTYKDGKLEGLYIEYESNGDTLRYGKYVEGEKAGVWKEFESGVLKMVYPYSGGKKHGSVLYYKPSGYVFKAKWFNYDVLYGHVEYDNKGKVTYRNELNNGEGTYLTHHVNGKEDFTVPVKNGKFNGKATSKYFDGTLEETLAYNQGEIVGTYTQYFYNGSVNNISVYNKYGKPTKYTDRMTNGLLNKKVTYSDTAEYYSEEYYCADQLMITSEYKEGNEHGQRIYYGENKEIAAVINLYLGKILSYTYMGADNKLVEPIVINNGSGEIKTTYKNGAKALNFTLVKGNIEGDFTLYYQNGQLATKKTFKNQVITGTAEEFTPKGVKTYTASFNDKGNFDGPLKEFTADGKLAYEVTYKNDQIVSEAKMLDTKTNKMIVLTYKDGKIVHAKK